MASIITLTAAPDASLGLAPVTKTIPLSDPADYQALLACYKDLLRVGYSTDDSGAEVYVEPSHDEIIHAITASLMTGIMNNVASWVRAKKLENVTVTTPTLTIS